MTSQKFPQTEIVPTRCVSCVNSVNIFIVLIKFLRGYNIIKYLWHLRGYQVQTVIFSAFLIKNVEIQSHYDIALTQEWLKFLDVTLIFDFLKWDISAYLLESRYWSCTFIPPQRKGYKLKSAKTVVCGLPHPECHTTLIRDTRCQIRKLTVNTINL